MPYMLLPRSQEGRVFLETLLRLDANGDHAGFLAFVQSKLYDPKDVFTAIHILLPKFRVRSAYILALLLANKGYRSPIICFALSVGGLLYQVPQEMARGLAGLQTASNWTDTDPAEFYLRFVAPVLTRILATASRTDNTLQIKHVFEILKAAAPQFQAILPDMIDWHAAIPPVSLEAMCQRGREQANLLTYPLPPAGAPRSPRRVVVAVRELVPVTQTWPRFVMPEYRFTRFDRIWPRPATVEPRLVAAMRAYGWQAELCPVKGFNLSDDYHAVIQACQQRGAELLILDDSFVLETNTGNRPIAPSGDYVLEEMLYQSRVEMLASLRLQMPSLKVAAILFDAGSVDPLLLEKAAAVLDVILDPTSPALPVWDRSAVADKVLHMPIPQASGVGVMDQPLLPHMVFAGKNTSYRIFWLQAARLMGLPVQQKPETFLAEEKLRLDRCHERSLAQDPCFLQWAGDPHQAGPVVDPSFATLLGGSLLVQEASPHMHRFFIPGEHYLEFATLTELAAIARFMAEHREACENIRRAGHAFACARYGDEKLIGYLDKFLYFPDQPAAHRDARSMVPSAPPEKLVTYEYVALNKWCKPVSPAELLGGTGNLVSCFQDVVSPTPYVPGTYAQKEGYEDLYPYDEELIAPMEWLNLDVRTRRFMPYAQPACIARLENVRIGFPGFGLFLDRHLVLEGFGIVGGYGARRTSQCDIPVGGMAGAAPTMKLDVKYYIDKGVDQYCQGPALLLIGYANENYCHWLFEVLPRLWCLEVIPELRSLPLILRAPLLPFQLETLVALGIAPERIKLFTGNLLQVETLIYASEILPGGGLFQCAAWLREKLLPALGVETISPPQGLIYISRAKAARRRALNEEQVTAQLEARGFKVLYFEEMTVKDQITAVRNARVVVLMHGAAAVNACFAQPETVFIELSHIPHVHIVKTGIALDQVRLIPCTIVNAHTDILVDVDVLTRVVDKVLADFDF
ncbi:MAG: DUF563 domain-containing protein [Magnetococcales bacterium]|nr:DUF563 domain-containing protein [Magnetococcales bacterium]